MIADFRDGMTLVITPETVAEQEILARFHESIAELERPQPFGANIHNFVLKIDDMDDSEGEEE